ncbi:MAG: hypothetical protein P4L45_06305, partial [Ignavibacteriaceae bacterium]|nr:hypothetical protein [Ignavibacteriaceae bacterium]
MKRLIFTLGIVIFFQFLLIGQNNHTYGPVRDQHWADVQDPNGGDHFVGRNSNGQGITYYNFVNWQWTYNNIPNATNLTSINIKFKAQYEDYSSHAFHFTLHYIESNWSGIDLSYYFNQVGYNNNRKVFEDNVSSDAGGVLTYNKTITSGALFDSVQAAITRGRYFVTLAFRSEDGTSPWWELYPYDGNVTQSDSPSIDLTLNFTTINQNYQLVNNIESSENYGTLKYFNNSNSTFGADSSGMIVGLDPNCNYSIRTNELPF